MNKKYIITSIIVVFLVAITSVAILYLTHQKDAEQKHRQEVKQQQVVWKKYHDNKYGYTVSYQDGLTINTDHSNPSTFFGSSDWMKIGENGSDNVSFSDGIGGYGWMSVQVMDTPLSAKEYVAAMKKTETGAYGTPISVVDKEMVVSGVPAIVYHTEMKGYVYPDGIGENKNLILRKGNVLFIFGSRGNAETDNYFVQSVRFDSTTATGG